MWTTAIHTATCTTAAPVPGWSGPLNCCMGTVWTPCVRATTSATWLWGARNRKRWVSSHRVIYQGQEKRCIYSDVFICPGNIISGKTKCSKQQICAALRKDRKYVQDRQMLRLCLWVNMEHFPGLCLIKTNSESLWWLVSNLRENSNSLGPVNATPRMTSKTLQVWLGSVLDCLHWLRVVICSII